MNPLDIDRMDPATLDNMRQSVKRESDLRRGRIDPGEVTRAAEPPVIAKEERLETDVPQDIAIRFNLLLDAFQALQHRVERLEAKIWPGEFMEDEAEETSKPKPKPSRNGKSKPKEES